MLFTACCRNCGYSANLAAPFSVCRACKEIVSLNSDSCCNCCRGFSTLASLTRHGSILPGNVVAGLVDCPVCAQCALRLHFYATVTYADDWNFFLKDGPRPGWLINQNYAVMGRQLHRVQKAPPESRQRGGLFEWSENPLRWLEPRPDYDLRLDGIGFFYLDLGAEAWLRFDFAQLLRRFQADPRAAWGSWHLWVEPLVHVRLPHELRELEKADCLRRSIDPAEVPYFLTDWQSSVFSLPEPQLWNGCTWVPWSDSVFEIGCLQGTFRLQAMSAQLNVNIQSLRWWASRSCESEPLGHLEFVLNELQLVNGIHTFPSHGDPDELARLVIRVRDRGPSTYNFDATISEGFAQAVKMGSSLAKLELAQQHLAKAENFCREQLGGVPDRFAGLSSLLFLMAQQPQDIEFHWKAAIGQDCAKIKQWIQPVAQVPVEPVISDSLVVGGEFRCLQIGAHGAYQGDLLQLSSCPDPQRIGFCCATMLEWYPMQAQWIGVCDDLRWDQPQTLKLWIGQQAWLVLDIAAMTTAVRQDFDGNWLSYSRLLESLGGSSSVCVEDPNWRCTLSSNQAGRVAQALRSSVGTQVPILKIWSESQKDWVEWSGCVLRYQTSLAEYRLEGAWGGIKPSKNKETPLQISWSDSSGALLGKHRFQPSPEQLAQLIERFPKGGDTELLMDYLEALDAQQSDRFPMLIEGAAQEAGKRGSKRAKLLRACIRWREASIKCQGLLENVPGAQAAFLRYRAALSLEQAKRELVIGQAEGCEKCARLLTTLERLVSSSTDDS
jgi:hypothetical protein